MGSPLPRLPVKLAQGLGGWGGKHSTILFLTIPIQIWNPQKPDYSTLLVLG